MSLKKLNFISSIRIVFCIRSKSCIQRRSQRSRYNINCCVQYFHTLPLNSPIFGFFKPTTPYSLTLLRKLPFHFLPSIFPRFTFPSSYRNDIKTRLFGFANWRVFQKVTRISEMKLVTTGRPVSKQRGGGHFILLLLFSFFLNCRILEGEGEPHLK